MYRITNQSQTVTLQTLTKWLPCVACGLASVRHTPFPGQSKCFVAVLLTLFDSY